MSRRSVETAFHAAVSVEYCFTDVRTYDDRKARLLNLIDEYTRECLLIPSSRHAKDVVLPLDIATSICRSRFTICSGLCFFTFPIIPLLHSSFLSDQLEQRESADQISGRVQVVPGQLHEERLSLQ